MEYADLVRRRRMTRRFRPDAGVPDETIEHLLALALRAPSAGFSQGWEYVVLRTPAERERFWAAAGPPAAGGRDDWLAGVRAAPVLILPLADEQAYRERYAASDKGAVPPAEQSWPVPYWLTDTAMGVMLLLLGAHDAGLATLLFGVPETGHVPVKAAFGIPDRLALLGVIALGQEERRVGGSAAVRPRRGVTDVAHWGAFGVPRAAVDRRVGENAGQTGPTGGPSPDAP